VNDSVELREVTEDDLTIFFEQQLDPTANHMAAFTTSDPTNRDVFMTHWRRLLANDDIMTRTILFKGQVAGHIECFPQFGMPSVGYWIGPEYWGRGIATAALRQFLRLVDERPLYARAAADNTGSIRVLEKCGFSRHSRDKGFANARGEEIEEVIMVLCGADGHA
jgi:RimJ/RimL family protein N-acetyltransferase